MTLITQINPLTGLLYRSIDTMKGHNLPNTTFIPQQELLSSIQPIDVKIYAHKTHIDAVIPQVAYNGTSMCFDLTCVEDTRIFPRSSAVIPNGLNLTIDQDSPYGMVISLRSSLGFKKELVPHYGDVDCVPAGTEISTPYGLKNVEDIFNGNDKKNKFVLSYNEETMDVETDEIEDMWIVKDKPLLSIETEDGITIEIPYIKTVYTKRGWVKAEDLTKDDYILKIID